MLLLILGGFFALMNVINVIERTQARVSVSDTATYRPRAETPSDSHATRATRRRTNEEHDGEMLQSGAGMDHDGRTAGVSSLK